MHILGVSVPLCCLFYHFVLTVITMVDYVVYVKSEDKTYIGLQRAHLAFSIVGLVFYGSCAAPLLVYSYKYGSSSQLRMDRMLGAIGVMFFFSSLPMVVVELALFLSLDYTFRFPLDGIVFILHAIAAAVGGTVTWFAYMRRVARALHKFRGPERQVPEDGEHTPRMGGGIVFSTPQPGQPEVI